MEFAGKVVIVTGAGSGLGQCLAVQLAESGAAVACVDYDERLLRETKS